MTIHLQDYELMPAIDLWRLQRQFPDNPDIARAVENRDLFHKRARQQNEVDRDRAEDRRRKLREMYAY